MPLIAFFAILSVLLCSSDASAQELNRRVLIVNQAAADVTGVFASSRDSRNWGSNRLYSRLQSGYQIELDLSDGSGACNLDVLIERADRRRLHATINACETKKVFVNSNSDNLPVKFINRTAKPIRYLYVGGPGWWSEDLLGFGISLPTDSSTDEVVRSSSGCRFRLRVVYWDDSDLVLENVDLCSNQNVEIVGPKR